MIFGVPIAKGLKLAEGSGDGEHFVVIKCLLIKVYILFRQCCCSVNSLHALRNQKIGIVCFIAYRWERLL